MYHTDTATASKLYIGLKDWGECAVVEQECVLYVEDKGSETLYLNSVQNHQGMDVYIRQATNPAAVAVEASPTLT